MSVLCHLWLLVLLSLGCAVYNQAHGAQGTLPCPSPEDVFPCVCTSDEEDNMDMDCSLVESEDQLRQVFSVFLPFPKFRELRILDNEHLSVLREGDLGAASFQVITVTGGILGEVEPGALAHSTSTLTEIDMQVNRLTKFPFEELPSWTSLKYLYLGDNALNVFPLLVSDSLLLFGMQYNLIADIPADAFKDVPKLELILIYGNTLKKITPGVFSDLNDLSLVDLSFNQLTHISNGDLPLTESRTGIIYLHDNNISSIAAGGITGLNDGMLSLGGNALTSLPEDVFRPILEGGASVSIYDNPLGCGCDIAWLITDASFMSQIDTKPPASCYNGTLLSDLDPSIFDDLC